MKRERDVELEVAVEEIVATATAKDEEGRYVEPIMQESNPMILTFFSAPDALLDVLKNRPLIFLNLLQTNKTLATFWQGVGSNIWPLLLDHFIEMEMGTYPSEVYPFFAIQHRRTYGERIAETLPMAGPWSVNHDIQIGFASTDPSTKYHIIYYDRYTWGFISLLRYIRHHHTRPSTKVSEELRRYLNIDRHSNLYVACLSDCFLVEEQNTTFTLDKEEMRSSLESMIAYKEHPTDTTNKKIYHLLKQIAEETRSFIETTPSIPLNKSTAKPYRDLLFDSVQGLYNTPEKQKLFFLTTLQKTGYTREVMIEKYGHSMSLECVMCRRETLFVDQTVSLAFCTDECRAQYI